MSREKIAELERLHRSLREINGAINIETLEPTTGFYDAINAAA